MVGTNLSSENSLSSQRQLDNTWVCYNQEESRAYLILACGPLARDYVKGDSLERAVELPHRNHTQESSPIFPIVQ